MQRARCSEVAPSPVIAISRDVRRVAPPCLEEVTPRTEVATLRTLVRQGKLHRIGLRGCRVLVGAGQRDASEQTVGVGVLRPREERLDRAFLDDLAGVHHGHPVADLTDQPEIVGDVDCDVPYFSTDVPDELGDASLHRDVEGGGRLVEQQEGRVRQQGHGDHHALLLAPEIWCGYAVMTRSGSGIRTSPSTRIARARAPARPSPRGRSAPPSAVGRGWRLGVQGGERLLIDHRDLRAPELAQLFLTGAW